VAESRCGLAISGRRVPADQVIGADDWACVLPDGHDGLHSSPDNTCWPAPVSLDPQEQP
jgi:hypothetical protein